MTYDKNPIGAYLRRFAAYYYNLAHARGQGPVINYKFNAFPERAAVLDLERSKMDRIREPFWQTDTAVATTSWGFIEDQRYKSVDRLVDDLVDIVSKNGCLLLNIGPRADGVIPDREQEMLREIGAWLKVNGEAIYGSRPWKVYGEGPTGTTTGHLSEGKNKDFTAEGVRFTTRGTTLYAIALGWPAEGMLKVQSLGLKSGNHPGELGTITLLGHDGELKFERSEAALTIRLPREAPGHHAFVFKITPR
jgi:alpha-L-fucosidase